jgi:hypothetical protein
MFKIIFPAILCLAFACPLVGQAQDCGCCEPQPVCQKTRKKLKIVEEQKEVCRLRRVCVVDECGCSKMKCVKVKECVTRKKLALVDVPVDPCKKSCFERFCEKIKSKCSSGDCCDPCCDPCCQ